MIVLVEHNVARLQVPMDYLHLTQILESHNYLRSHVPCQRIVERSLPLEKVKQAAFRTVLDQQVQLVLILKRLVKLDDRWMVQACKNAALDKDLLDPTLVQESGDEHLLQAIVALAFTSGVTSLLYTLILELHLKHGAIGPIANLGPRCKVGAHKGTPSLLPIARDNSCRRMI